VSLQQSEKIGRARFPALLLEQHLLSGANLEVAEKHASSEGVELADAIVALGLAAEPDVYAALARSAGLDFMSLRDVAPSELALRLVPERIARRHTILPLRLDNRTVTYVSCRPFHAEADQDVAFASGRRTAGIVASRSELLAAIEQAYPKLRELDVLAERIRAERPHVEAADGQERTASPSAVIQMCDHIIGRAVELGASDVHLDYGVDGTTVRYRICGVLEPVLTLPAAVSRPIGNRFKILGGADISVRHRPQDGAFRIKVNGRPIDVRLSTLPSVDGEKMVLRVIDSVSPLQELDRMGYDPDTLARLRRALARPDGLVLVSGPTGCGKTTVLYAALNHLRTGRTNIVSVEDPVERKVAGVTQIPVNQRSGNTFPSVIRSLLRQDPDVIMVGEIRDGAVAEIVGQAAYTGHLVLSSLHTVDAATAILRLQNLGLEPYKIAESLSAILAQRLLRSLCPECRINHDELEARRRGIEHGVPRVHASVGPGCAKCNHTGYDGRVPVAELLTPTDQMREAITRGATPQEIRAAMRASGFPTLQDQAARLVALGVTSIEEVHRVLSTDDAAVQSKAHAKLRVLVTDDEPITRMLVKLLLEQDGFEVLEATHGRQAVDIARREHPDLLLIDLHMPTMDGYAAIAELRRDFTLSTLPIIVLTAEEGPGVEERVLELGADDYLLKPFDPAVLRSRVNAVFRRLKALAA
jgi:type IV pilus assembly protein PilB